MKTVKLSNTDYLHKPQIISLHTKIFIAYNKTLSTSLLATEFWSHQKLSGNPLTMYVYRAIEDQFAEQK